MGELGPAGKLSEGAVQCLTCWDIVLRHRKAITRAVMLRLCLEGSRLRPSAGHALTQIIRHIRLTGYALDLWLLEDLLALTA